MLLSKNVFVLTRFSCCSLRWLKNSTKHYGCNWQLIMKLFKQVAWHRADIPGMNQLWQRRYGDPIYFNCALPIGFISQVVHNEDAKNNFSKATMSRRKAPDDFKAIWAWLLWGWCFDNMSSPRKPGLAQLIKVLLRGQWTLEWHTLEQLARRSAVCNRKEAEMGEAWKQPWRLTVTFRLLCRSVCW